MSYEALLEQIKAAPEECLDEISNYVNYVIYRYEKQKTAAERFGTSQGKVNTENVTELKKISCLLFRFV